MGQFRKEEQRKKSMDLRRKREMVEVNAGQIGEKQRIELNQKLRTRKELKEMQDRTREFEAQTQLEQMRRRRIHAEMSLDQLARAREKHQTKIEQGLMDKS